MANRVSVQDRTAPAEIRRRTVGPLAGAQREQADIRILLRSAWILLIPAAVLYGFAMIYPLGELLFRSLHLDGVDKTGLTVENYVHVLTEPLFRRVILTSLEVAGLVTLVCILIGYPVAYLMHTANKRWTSLFLVLLLIPLLTSVLVRSFAWIALLLDNGVINEVLQSLGLNQPLDLLHNRTGVLIGMINAMLPYFVLPVFSVMRGIDPRLVPAAESLGARPSTAFRHIFLPLSFPGVAAGGLLTFILSLGYYITPAMLGGRADVMIAQLVQTEVSNLGAFNLAAALAVVLMTVTLLLLFAFTRVFRFSQLFSEVKR